MGKTTFEVTVFCDLLGYIYSYIMRTVHCIDNHWLTATPLNMSEAMERCTKGTGL